MKGIVVAHNQLKVLPLALESLNTFAGMCKNDIIVVDNGSEDGTSDWLKTQENLAYIICDEGVENYSRILNIVMSEFEIEDDCLILMPNYMVLPETVQKLVKLLHEDVQIGAVTAGLVYKDDAEGDNKQRKNKRDNIQVLDILPGAVMICRELLKKLGGFDERLRLPESVIKDFVFRGVCQGYRFYKSNDVYFYKVDKDITGYEEDVRQNIDRSILKQIWNMNYFNVKPNFYLLTHMKEEKSAKLKILEIGCDCGANLLEIKNNFPFAELYGIEINEKSAEIASHIAHVQIANIEEKQIYFEQIKFDYIIFGDVLEHLRDPAGVLKYCSRLLQNNGKVIASIPNIMHYSVMRGLLQGNFTYTDTGLLDRTHIHFFTYKEIVKMFEENGYQINDTMPIIDVSQKDYKFVDKLMEIAEGVEREMFCTYQYLIAAEKKKGFL